MNVVARCLAAAFLAAWPVRGGALAESESWRMTAALVDADKNALSRSIVVQVNVDGVELVDPLAANGKAAPGQGHLEYKLDDGPVISAVGTRMGFHRVAAGRHRLTVLLAGNDGRPLGPGQVLVVDIP